MSTPSNASWTLRFSLFGVPVAIHPVSWMVLAILGGALGVSDDEGLVRVLVFVLMGMLTLLVHELGHALTGRATGALVEQVEIAGMGGSTRFAAMPASRWVFALVTLAGPLASLLLGALLGALFGLQLGNVWAGVQYAFLMPWMPTLPMDLQQQIVLGFYTHGMPDWLAQLYSVGMLICFWWSVFNLLPIFPLDGGKLLGSLFRNYKVPCVLGLLLGAGLGVWAMLESQWINMMILGYLAFINWQYLRVFLQRR